MVKFAAIIFKPCLNSLFVIGLFLLTLLGIGARFPDTLCGTMAFQLFYHTFGAERSLPLYGGVLALMGQKTLPEDSDRYLVRQLFDGAITLPEREAILDFYLSRSSQGASKYMMVHKREMGRQLMVNFSAYTPAKKLAVLIMLQDLETGHHLDNAELEHLVKNGLPQAGQLLSNWQQMQKAGQFSAWASDGTF